MRNNQLYEFGCNTCKHNFDIGAVDFFERNHKSTYIPLKIRRTTNVGIVFTNSKGDTMYNWHIKNGAKHDWYNLSEAEEFFRANKNLQQKLDATKIQ